MSRSLHVGMAGHGRVRRRRSVADRRRRHAADRGALDAGHDRHDGANRIEVSSTRARGRSGDGRLRGQRQARRRREKGRAVHRARPPRGDRRRPEAPLRGTRSRPTTAGRSAWVGMSGGSSTPVPTATDDASSANRQLANPVSIVGGTARALGFGLALRLGRAGVPIIIGSRDEHRAQESARRAAKHGPNGQFTGRQNAEPFRTPRS